MYYGIRNTYAVPFFFSLFAVSDPHWKIQNPPSFFPFLASLCPLTIGVSPVLRTVHTVDVENHKEFHPKNNFVRFSREHSGPIRHFSIIYSTIPRFVLISFANPKTIKNPYGLLVHQVDGSISYIANFRALTKSTTYSSNERPSFSR